MTLLGIKACLVLPKLTWQDHVDPTAIRILDPKLGDLKPLLDKQVLGLRHASRRLGGALYRRRAQVAHVHDSHPLGETGTAEELPQEMSHPPVIELGERFPWHRHHDRPAKVSGEPKWSRNAILDLPRGIKILADLTCLSRIAGF